MDVKVTTRDHRRFTRRGREMAPRARSFATSSSCSPPSPSCFASMSFQCHTPPTVFCATKTRHTPLSFIAVTYASARGDQESLYTRFPPCRDLCACATVSFPLPLLPSFDIKRGGGKEEADLEKCCSQRRSVRAGHGRHGATIPLTRKLAGSPSYVLSPRHLPFLPLSGSRLLVTSSPTSPYAGRKQRHRKTSGASNAEAAASTPKQRPGLVCKSGVSE